MKKREFTIKPEQEELSLKAIKEAKELMKQGKAIPEVVINGNEVTMKVSLLSRFDRYRKRKEEERKAKYEQKIQEQYKSDNIERQTVSTNLNNSNTWKEMYKVKSTPVVNNNLNNYEKVKGYRTFDSVNER